MKLPLSKIYDSVPFWLQNVLVTIAGYRNSRSRYGKAYFEHKEFLRKFDALSLSEKQEYQCRELVRFVRYAYENSPFYRELYKNVDISKILQVEDLRLLPIVDKEMLRANADQVFTVSPRGMLKDHTGGTTGKSLMVLRTPEDMMKRMAMLDYFKERVGFQHLKMRRATFNGKHVVPPGKKKIFWRYNHACKQMIYSSFHITEGNARCYIKSLNRFKPHALDGFFSSLIDIANHIERYEIPLEFQPVAIFPTSETLTQPGRELLERVFKCKVYDQYASSEGAPFVTECEHQNLHIELASGIFEYFEQGSDEVLVTSFTTHGTPLIRYRIGDAMRFAPPTTSCPCGRQSPLVESIRGRKLDFVYTAERAKIYSGNIANAFKNLPNSIVKAQVIQERVGELTVKIQVDREKYECLHEEMLRNEFLHKFGDSTKIAVEQVPSIPRELSGKFMMIKNLVDGRE